MKPVGELDEHPVYEAALRSDAGVEVTILSYGARVKEWRVPVSGDARNVVVGLPDFSAYRRDRVSYFGAIVGRVANRIRDARFELHGKTYRLVSDNPAAQLHGGPGSAAFKNWRMSATPESITLDLHSPAGDMGFPGIADLRAVYRLEDHRLHIDLSAQVSEETPISLVQHNYFNLLGGGDVRDHLLRVQAPAYTEVDANLVLTGKILPVDNTMYDFRDGRTLHGKYDINLVLASDRGDGALATLTAPDRSLQLKLWSTQPGLQLYNGQHLGYTGVCLEDQMFPDAVNHPDFPSILVGPDRPYHHSLTIEIKPPRG